MPNPLAFTVKDAFNPFAPDTSLLHIFASNYVDLYDSSPPGVRPVLKSDVAIAWVMKPMFTRPSSDVDSVVDGTQKRGVSLQQLVVTIDADTGKFENSRLIGANEKLPDPPVTAPPTVSLPPLSELSPGDLTGPILDIPTILPPMFPSSMLESFVRLDSNSSGGSHTKYLNVDSFSIKRTNLPASIDFNHERMQFFAAKNRAYIFNRSSLLAVLSHMESIVGNNGPIPNLYFSGYRINTGAVASDLAMLEFNYLKSKTNADYSVNYGLKAEVVTETEVINANISANLSGFQTIQEYFDEFLAPLPMSAYGIPCPPKYGIHGAFMEIYANLAYKGDGLTRNIVGGIGKKPGFIPDMQNLSDQVETVVRIIGGPTT